MVLAGCAKKEGQLSAKEKQTVKRILIHWETWVPDRKKDGTAPLMNFDQLYQGLGPEEKAFLEKVRTLKPGGKLDSGSVPFESIARQSFEKDGQIKTVDVQYLPRWTYEAYQSMMGAMQRDLGKRLLIESGYRSPAYQLYTFIFYLPKHRFNLKETNRWVALPGHSEHGDPDRQAVDFINQQGINGDDEGQSAETFEKLPEFLWLTRHAKEFGFELSYPRSVKDAVYEPWHWRFVRKT